MTKKEMRNKLNQDLVEFLKQNKCLTKYIDNCYKQQYITKYVKDYPKPQLLDKEHMLLYIQEIKSAFVWSYTQEAFVFWDKLHHKFNKLQSNKIYQSI